MIVGTGPGLGPRPKSTRTKAGHAIGTCPECGYVMADTSKDRRPCGGCGIEVILRWVYGELSDEPCDGRCMGATGPDCSCACGGTNHGGTYMHVELVPEFVRARDADRHAARVAGKQAAMLRRRAAGREELVSRYPVLAWLSYRANTGEALMDREFMASMREAFQRGEMSLRQAQAAVAQIVRETDERDRRAALVGAGITAPRGVQEVAGAIVSVRLLARRYGDRWTMTVEADAGYRVHGSCPASVLDAFPEPERAKGARVRFTATFEGTARDPLFATFSRPRKVTVLDRPM